MQESYRERDQLLALKVMRLTKPTLKQLMHVTCEEEDFAGEIFESDINDDISTLKGVELFGTGQLLCLPQAFGSIYLGETLSCCINILNDSNQVVKNIVLKTDLQTVSQQLQLYASGPYSQLKQDHSVDNVINYEVKELGTHILVCAVTYTSSLGEKMYLRKFFKFQVLKPLEVKTKFYNVDESVFLEAQVQNITGLPICVVAVNLEPSQFYSVEDLNMLPKNKQKKDEMIEKETPSKQNIFGQSFMGIMDTRQYLYRLTENKEELTPGENRAISLVGKLDIMWQTNFGEMGRLQTSQLQRVLPGLPSVRITVVESPDVVPLNTEFGIKICLHNSSDTKLELKQFLTNPKHGGLLWSGLSGQVLGTLIPKSSIEVALTLIAVKTGLQVIGGVRMLDLITSKVFEFSEISKILVYNTAESPFS